MICEGQTSGTGEKAENPGNFVVHSRSPSAVLLAGFSVASNNS
jgi:hypothetical protein